MTDEDRIAELLTTWCEARAMGIDVDAEQLLEQHPELADEIRTKLETLGALDLAFSTPRTRAMFPPQNIGPYRIVQEIGRGGMGVVYEAEQTTMNRRVALKVLAPSITGPARSINRFKLEAHAAGRLQHTNIVPVHDMGQQDGYWFYAMELVDGQSLSQVLEDLRAGGDRAMDAQASTKGFLARRDSGDGSHQEGSASWFRSLAQTIAGVADALDLAHREGIVHRDIKPSNLLLDAEGTLKLVDFGLAHLDGNGPSMTRTGDMLGTPAYMSPEQAQAKRVEVDHRTDIYSLGATVYELLTLKPPFEGETLHELCAEIVNQEPVRPRVLDHRIPKDLETIVLKALEKERAKRYQSASELAQDLRQFCEGGPIRARRVGVAGRTWRKIKRHKTVSSLVAALLLIAAAGTATALKLAEKSRTENYAAALQEADDALFSSWALGLTDWSLTERARERLDLAIGIDPERPDAYWRRALLSGPVQSRLGDLDKAQHLGFSEMAAHYLRANLLPRSDAEEHYRLAEYANREGTATELCIEAVYGRPRTLEEQIDLLDRAIESPDADDPAYHLALRFRARLYETSGDLQRAREDLHGLRFLGQESVVRQIQIAHLTKRLGDDSDAERQLEDALSDVNRSHDPGKWSLLAGACLTWSELEWAEKVTMLARVEYPDDARLMARRARLLARQGNVKEAFKLSHDAVNKDPHDFVVLLAHAFNLGKSGRRQDAINTFQSMVNLRPDDFAAHHNLALALGNRGQLKEGIDHARKAVGLAPDQSKAQGLLASLLDRAGDHEGANAAHEEALRRASNDSLSYLMLGDVYVRHGQFEFAIEALQRALALNQNRPTAWSLLAEAYRKKGGPDLVISALEKSRDLYPENPDVYALLAGAYSEKGEFELFIENGQAAIARGLHDPRFYYVLASSLHLDLEDPSGAIPYYEKAIELRPDYPEARTNLAGILIDRGNIEEAIGHLELAIENKAAFADPDEQAVAWHSLGIAYQKQGGKSDEAIAAFEEALEIRPRWGHVQVLLARELHARISEFIDARQVDKAAEHLERAIELLQNDPDYLSHCAYDYIRLGDVHLSEGDPEKGLSSFHEAVELCERALRHDFKTPRAEAGARDTLGTALRLTGDLERAFAEYVNATEADSSYPDPYYNLACLEAIREHTEDALNWLKKAVEAGWNHAEWAASDPDLQKLQDDPSFKEILDRMKGRKRQN